MTQQWWHGDIDGKQMQFGGVLGDANGCDDLRPGEMECTLNLPCLTCFGRTCFGMVFLIRSLFFLLQTGWCVSYSTLSSGVCAHDILVASLALGEGDQA